MTTSATPNTPAHEHGGDHDVHRPATAAPTHAEAEDATHAVDPHAIPDVAIVDVTKRFDDVTAVDAMSLSVASGAFYSFLGPSGCGKTTTLRMIAGFEQPTSGEIYLAGEPVAGVPPYRRNVNTVFQHYALFPHMNVSQNVGYGLRQKKASKADEARRVGEALELVRLSRLRAASDLGAVGRAAAARRARPGARQPPHGAAPGRAAGRPRPQAPPRDADRAQAAPARGRDHVHLRDPRPGGGADDERRHRRHARRPDPAAGPPRGPVRAAGQPVRRRLRRDVELPRRQGRGDRRGDGHRHRRDRLGPAHDRQDHRPGRQARGRRRGDRRDPAGGAGRRGPSMPRRRSPRATG